MPTAHPNSALRRAGSGGRPIPAVQHAFLAACRRRPTSFTPVWLMRQAGRFLPEYRAIRERLAFLELCRTPDVAAEVTVLPGGEARRRRRHPLRRHPPRRGAARGRPRVRARARGRSSTARCARRPTSSGWSSATPRRPCPSSSRRCAGRAPRSRSAVPLIGFAGAPFTVASYLVEGGASRDYLQTKRLMYGDPGAWHALLALLARTTARYLNGQIAAGAQAVQLFDSWVGALGPDDYRAFVLPVHAGHRPVAPARRARDPLRDRHGGAARGASARRAATSSASTGGSSSARPGSGSGTTSAIQGNLDPAALFAPPAEIRRRAAAILAQAAGRPGHIFNLGHGVLPGNAGRPRPGARRRRP